MAKMTRSEAGRLGAIRKMSYRDKRKKYCFKKKENNMNKIQNIV